MTRFVTALLITYTAPLRAGTGSGAEVKEAGHGAAKLRRCRNRTRGVNHDHEVRMRGHDKRIGHAPDGCAQTYDSAVAQIIETQVCWIVTAQVCSALDVTSAAGCSVNGDRKARR